MELYKSESVDSVAILKNELVDLVGLVLGTCDLKSLVRNWETLPLSTLAALDWCGY